MAIVFTYGKADDKLRLAYNNDVFKFYSDGGAATHCDITSNVGSPINLRLYPDPQGMFYLNLRPYITSLINTAGFADTITPEIDGSDNFSFIYPANEMYYSDILRFTVFFNDNTSEFAVRQLKYIPGVEQIGNVFDINATDTLLLSPFALNTANKYLVKYWQGYPFDISLYKQTAAIFKLKNLSNLLDATFSKPGVINRLFFSDGRTDESIEDVLPLANGHNSVRVMTAENESVTDKFLTVHKVPYKCGVYLKWFNKFGGYSYWLFEHTFAVERSSKAIGELDYDNTNLEDAVTKTRQIGQQTQDTYKLLAELLTAEERNIVEGIISSPKIYMFTGKPFSQNGPNAWIEVTLKTNNIRLKNFKETLTNIAIDIELPQHYTQTL